MTSTPSARPGLVAAWASWPLGLLLVLVVTALAPPAVVAAPLLLAYGAAVVLYLRRGPVDPAASGLVLAGPGIFTLAGLTGPPTAREPAAMLANAAVLGAAGAVLLACAVVLALRAGHGGRVPAALGVVALAVGSAGYLLNLLLRGAVVASGAAAQQAAVEDAAWWAASYLTGLDGEPGLMTVLLVWSDLTQLAYLAIAYAGFGALAAALGLRGVARAGYGLAGLVVAGVAVAALLPGTVGAVGAWTAFVLTIPFMSTLVPYALGVALLRAGHPAAGSARKSLLSRRTVAAGTLPA
ncbi:MAG: hypothetical protein AB7G09_17755 [Pseudonocardia sp.]